MKAIFYCRQNTTMSLRGTTSCDTNSHLGRPGGSVEMLLYGREISEKLWQLFGDFSSDRSGGVLKLRGRHPTGHDIVGVDLEERTNEMSVSLSVISSTRLLQRQILLTCMRGTSAESCFLTSSRFCSGSRRGEKSVTTTPSLRSATKPGRTCPAAPSSRWNWMSRVLHCCLEMGRSAVKLLELRTEGTG